jgi:pimeloyl-ACP methyl ester carboxylesterase
MTHRAAVEGYVPFRGMRTWYRAVGERATPGRIPLLLLHGGPGMPSDPLESLEALADGGRSVIRYDQIGCGRSDRPRDPSLWRVESFVDELAAVRRELGLDRVHLLGWSWGGMLALEYLLAEPRPAGVASLVLASAPASAPFWLREVRRLRDDLPKPVVRAMRRYEDAYRPPRRRASTRVRPGVPAARAQRIARVARPVFGLLGTRPVVAAAARASAVPAFRRAAYEIVGTVFIRRHLVRREASEVPLSFFRAFAGMNREVYETMWGPGECCCTGVLRSWDVSDRLHHIRVPTLITSGRYDEATPVQMESIHRRIPGSEWVVFEESAHAALVEEPERYRGVLADFLARVEDREPVAAASKQRFVQ